MEENKTSNVTPTTSVVEETTPAPTNTVTPEPTAVSATPQGNSNKTLFIVLGIIFAIIACCCAVFAIVWFSGASFLNNTANLIQEEWRESLNESTTGGLSGDVNNDDTYYNDSFEDFFATGLQAELKNVAYEGNNLVITLDVKNNSNTETTFSTILYLTLVDGSGRTYSQNLLYSVDSSQMLDKSVLPGQTITGKVAYIVNDNPANLTLEVKESIFSQNPKLIKIK